MEKRIRPWINKKIVEYIGEEEPTLVEFICSKIMAGSAAQSILDDVSMVRIYIYNINELHLLHPSFDNFKIRDFC